MVSQFFEIGKLRLGYCLVLLAILFSNPLFAQAEPAVKIDAPELEQKIENLYQKVTNDNRFIAKLDESYRVDYPVGIQAGSGDANYAILLEQDKITTKGMFLTAYMRFEIPGNGKVLMFKADAIHLSKTGGLIGEVRLHLVGDKPINIIKDQVDMVLKGNDCYVTMDCSGFKSFTLGGDILFSSNVFVAEDIKNGSTKPAEKIKSSFSVSMADWNDMLIDISIIPFQLKAFPGFGFELAKAVIDLSDTRNYESMKFPARYNFSDEVNGNISLWQGVYIQKATVRLPGSLNKGMRQEISALDMLIDDQGFSGTISATNILTLEKGNLAGWPFSIDNLSIELLKGSVTKGSLAGKIVIPISNEKDALTYSAIVDANGEFSFSASSPKNINVPCFMATMTIDQSSKITINKVNGEYQATAALNGQININAKMDKPKENEEQKEETAADKSGFYVSGLKFQGLTLTTQAPHFKMGVWSLNSFGYDDKTNGFSITISNIKSFEEDDKKGLEFMASLSLMSGSYAAKAVIAISGKQVVTKKADGTDGRTKWKYSGTEVKEVYLKAEDEVISLTGYFAIYNKHAVYGDGISGTIVAGILPKTLGLQVAATAIFGNVNSMRYWYFDALVAFKQGIAMGPVALYGFGGGAYYHMKRENMGGVQIKEEKVVVSASNIGVTASGLKYVPDANISFGLKATVIIGLPGNPKAFNGDATFEIAFNNKGGINTVGFLGNGYIMSELVIGKPRTDAQISASLDIAYDFPNSSLHGVMDLKINAAEGLITGGGRMEMHFDPHKWYIYVGTPTSRINVTANYAGIAKVNTGAYFVIGTVIPPFAEVPNEVKDILKLDYKKPEQNSDIQAGKGFAFGMNYNFSTPRLDVAIFYAQFGMGMGFDVMLANFGSNTICVETNKTVGLNGWYALGQAYAYVKGDIGARVKFMGKQYNKKILYIAAAVLLQAELPNPIWLKGTVGGEWDLFGGVISGNCNFKVELGTKCTMKKLAGNGGASSAISGLDIISALTPENDRTEIDVFTNPQVVFNYKIGTEFEVVDESDKKFSVKVVLDHFKITADGKNIAGSYQWNSRNDVYVFTPTDILPGKTKISLEAKVHFEQNNGSGWQTVTEGGAAISQSLSNTFTTGVAPDYIPENNVSFMYPMKDQLNFMKGEYDKGYMKLIKGQAYLFEQGAEWKQQARYKSVKDGSVVTSDLSYSNGFISYSLPGINNSTIYKLEFANIPNSTVEIDKNISQKTQDKTEEGEKLKVKSQQAEGTLTVHQEKNIYTSYFRTSKYSQFKEKTAKVISNGSITESVGNGIAIIYGSISFDEVLDNYELASGGLLQLTADESGLWLKSIVIPIVYYKYPVVSYSTIQWRNPEILGVVPSKSIVLNAENIGLLTEAEKKSGDFITRTQSHSVKYKFKYYSQLDFNEITSLLLNGSTSNSDVQKYLQSMHPSYILGKYPVIVHYNLPGISSESSTSVMNLEY